MASRIRSPPESSHGDLVHHSSSSSVQSGNSPHLSPRNRPRKDKLSSKPTPSNSNRARVPSTDEPSTILPGGTKSQGPSRRASASSMRRSSIPLEAPLTYTPTTHRVSKAKKGKRVHACEFPGCNKVSWFRTAPPSLFAAPPLRHIMTLTLPRSSPEQNIGGMMSWSPTHLEQRI